MNGLRKYVAQVIKEGRLDYAGTGKERREYIHVQDAARLSADILEKPHEAKAITITGQQVINSSDLIDLIFEIAGVQKKVNITRNELTTDHYETTPYRFTSRCDKGSTRSVY